MLDNKKLLATVIVLALAGVLTLFFLSMTVEPEPLTINQISEEHIGMLVKVNATIQSVNTWEETAVIILSDLQNNTLIVFMYSDVYDDWPEAYSALPGAKLEVVGVIEKYSDGLELVVSSADDLKITAPATSNFIPVSQLLSAPDTFRGMTVKTNGTLHSPEITSTGMSFELLTISDGYPYNLKCEVTADNIEGVYIPGDEVVVTGEFMYDPNEGHWLLEIPGEGSITDPD